MSHRQNQDNSKNAVRLICLLMAGVMIVSVIAAAVFGHF